MKKITFMLTLLCWSGMAIAQDGDYLPLLREGVKWVYAYAPKMDESGMYKLYSVEFKGETEIDGTQYKQCWRQYLNADGNPTDELAECVANVRESDKRVFAILPTHDGMTHTAPGLEGEHEGEWLVYDFNDVPAFYAQMPKETFYTLSGPQQRGFECVETTTMKMGSGEHPAYRIKEPTFTGMLVEGYGVLGDMHDHLMDPYFKSLDVWSSSEVMTCGVYYIEENGVKVYHNEAYDSMIVSPAEPAKGDVNGDGKVDVEDVNALVNIILKLDQE